MTTTHIQKLMLTALLLMSTVAAAKPQTAFQRLDSLIAVQPQIVADKEQHLLKMKAELNTITSDAERYVQLKHLYEEYSAYQYDSAYSYVMQSLHVAEKMNNVMLANEAKLNLMHILSTACLMDKAKATMQQIDTTQLTPEQLITYSRIRTDMLIYQLEYMQGTQYVQYYADELIALRHEITSRFTLPDNINYQLTMAEALSDQGQVQRSIELLNKLLADYSPGERIYSIITSTQSFYYSKLGNKQAQINYLIKSAESDLEGCIRENTSLRQIADHLFDEGDIDRAYRYMRVAVDDANFYGTRLRNVQSARIVPKILNAYETKQHKNQRNMMVLLTVISVIALLLVGGVIAIYQLLKRYRRLNEQKKEINEQLHEVNSQLNDTVAQLRESNSLLHEREQLKEQYIARFLTLSSRFIDRGEEQRKMLYRLYRDRKTDELMRELKGTHQGNENAQLFYENFDNAFLNIYPNFVNKVNQLLQPDEQIEVKQGKRLTTESRVLALIRIGITDNQSIANILRASLTTIYTYRSKLKARAINKDEFEDRVKAIDC